MDTTRGFGVSYDLKRWGVDTINGFIFHEGDIILTRNLLESDNNSPGWFNHTSIYVGSGIVEAQEKPNAVILSDTQEFYNRYPVLCVYCWPGEDGFLIAEEAKKYIGKPYRKFASIRPLLLSKGENCVSTVRKVYKSIVGFDPKWRIPDDIAEDKRLVCIHVKDTR